MNSRTVHIVLFFFVVIASLITVSHVHAQSATDTESNESAITPTSKPTVSYNTTEVYAQLPLLSSEVGTPEEAESQEDLKKAEPVKKTSSTPTPTTKLQATASPTPTKAAEVSITPTVKPEVSSLSTVGGLDADKLFNMSNEYRKARGLTPFQKDDKTCALAASRAPEVSGEVAAGTLHSRLKARNLDYWNTENIIAMSTEESAFNWWINDKIHHDAIVGNFKYSCVACHGNSCAQEFTNYQPK